MEMRHLYEQIDSLSVEEKADLLDAIWESLEADASLPTEAQRTELNRRISLIVSRARPT